LGYRGRRAIEGQRAIEGTERHRRGRGPKRRHISIAGIKDIERQMGQSFQGPTVNLLVAIFASRFLQLLLKFSFREIMIIVPIALFIREKL
jgi:hypothetical protein